MTSAICPTCTRTAINPHPDGDTCRACGEWIPAEAIQTEADAPDPVTLDQEGGLS